VGPAGRELPLPGTHRAAEPAYSLRERITFRFAAELDLLLEKATQIEPQDRVSMAGMARELRACAAPPPETRPSAGLAELHTRVAALTAVSRQQVSQVQDRKSLILEAHSELAQLVADTATGLSDQLTFYVHSQDSGYQAAALLERPQFTAYDAESWGWLLLPPGQRRPAVEVTVAASFRMMSDDDSADIAALVRVDRILSDQGLHDPHEICARTYLGIPVASAQQANVMADIRVAFTSSFSGTLRQVIQILTGGE
jgi:hypothetical protein